MKTISSSKLRTEIKRILNEVEYGRAQYIVEKFGQPAAAIVSLDDLAILQDVRQQDAISSLRETITGIRSRSGQVDAAELDELIDEARAEFHQMASRPPDAR